MKDREQASTNANSHLLLFMKWYHKSSTLNKFVQCLRKWRTPIGYVNSEAKDELKIGDNKCKRYPSQRKIEQTQERFLVAYI